MSERYEVNLETVNTAITNYAKAYEIIVEKFGEIDKKYLNGIQNIWNTTTAYKYIYSVSTTLNKTISEMNKNFSEASDAIQLAAKKLRTGEGGIAIKSAPIPTIKSTSIGWKGNDAKFVISDKIKDETDKYFSSDMTEIIEQLKICRKAMRQIREYGLGEYISGDAIGAITDMISSAETVVNNYNSDAIKNASTEDANVRGYKIQTS